MADLDESYWFQEMPAKKTFPIFTGNLEVDVAVVGGGIAGLTAAYFLSRRGLRVALLEQELVAGGDSGYTTAFISHFLDNAEDAKRTWAASEQALETIERIIKDKKINCDFKRLDAVSFTKKEGSLLEAESQLFLSADSSIRFFKGTEAAKLCGFGAKGAILIKHEAVFHPRKYLLNVAKIIASEGGEIFEKSRVLDIKDGGNTILVENGEIRAKATIIATGYPPAAFPEVAKLILQSATYVVGLRFESQVPFKDYLFWDDETPYHYFRRINDYEVILGGEEHAFLFKKTSDVKTTQDHFLNLKNYMKNLTGKECEIMQKWEGGIFNTLDNLPYIGRHPTYGENIYFACGFSGNGITLGTLAGEIISDMIIKQDNKFIRQFAFAR